jgi:hypothetical protein
MADLTPSFSFPLIVNAHPNHTPRDGSPAAAVCPSSAVILRANR